MASELHDTLARLQRKSAILIEKYQALLGECQLAQNELDSTRQRVQELEARVEQLETDNQYLRMAHTIAPSPESVAQSRAMISKLVRDIDRCISQLNT